RKWFDGESSKRLVAVFQELGAAKRIVLKKADASHADVTLAWARNPEIRRFSFNQREISEEEHRDWFAAKLKDPNCLYLIGSIGDEAFGSVRFDIKDGSALISYLIDPHFQGLALGRSLLAAGMR